MSWDSDKEEDVQENMRKEEERKRAERSAGKRSLLGGLDMGDGSTARRMEIVACLEETRVNGTD